MKRFSLLTVLFLAVGAIYFTACQKDAETTAVSKDSPTTLNDEVSDRQSTVSLSYISPCGTGRSCLSWSLTNTKVNGFRVSVPTNLHNLYNAPSANGLTYVLYSGGSCLLPTGEITRFTCKNQKIDYAYTSLANGATYRLKVLYYYAPGAFTEIDCKTVTMGYNNGVDCNISYE